jgi:hypothetical protein
MTRFFVKLILLVTAVNVAACTNAEKDETKSLAPDAVFFDYRIWAEEGKEGVTCLFQFRRGGPNGHAVLLQDPARIELDGNGLTVDSAGLSGVFYEMVEPVNEFEGRHTIAFTNAEGKQYKEEIEFIPFNLSADLPGEVPRKPLTIVLEDFPKKETAVRLTLTDTAFATNDVNEIVMVEDGKLKITQSMLNKLKSGPVSLEIFKEEERSVRYTIKESGKVWVSYGLRREFELVD